MEPVRALVEAGFPLLCRTYAEPSFVKRWDLAANKEDEKDNRHPKNLLPHGNLHGA